MRRHLVWAAGWVALLVAASCTTRGRAEHEARRVCGQLHTFPEERRSLCCGSAPGLVLTDQCVALLAAALGEGALLADGSRIDGCTAALRQAHAGCEWVGPFGPPLPPECQALFSGRRKAGESCRSSLECRDGLFCAVARSGEAGRCSPPGPRGAECGTTVDALAGYTRQDLARLHPQCEGFCNRHRCDPLVALGSTCHSSAECGPAAHCATGRCVAGQAAVGESCSGGDCAWGLRCIQRTCRAPLASGAVCSTDVECQGGCVPTPSNKRCAMRCDLR